VHLRTVSVGILSAVMSFSAVWPAANASAARTSDAIVGGSLTAVSCPTVDECVAVGRSDSGALVEVSHGATWSVVPASDLGLPAGMTQVTLDAVACVSGTNCTAAGFGTEGTSAVKTLVERWNGTNWRATPSPTPASTYNSPYTGGNANLYAVSCPSSSACMAVGTQYLNYSEGIQGTLAEVWNGSTWSVSQVPDPVSTSSQPGTVARLVSVVCSSRSSCMAVGTYGEKVLADRWNGSTWSPSPVLGPGTVPELESVSCVSASSCTAVGGYIKAGSVEATLAERFTGSTWHVLATSNPGSAGQPIGFHSVSCPSTLSCTAVGAYTKGTSKKSIVYTLVEEWNGQQWSVVPSPNVSGSLYSGLEAVSCPTATECTAVGGRSGSSIGSAHTLVEHWDGSKWAVVTSP